MIYLASPYSHPDLVVRQQRFEAACRAAATLIQRGHVVFSPVAHSHSIAQHGLPLDWGFWEVQDREFVAACDELWVLMLEGWEQSRGVHAEIAIARALGKPIRFVDQVELADAQAAAAGQENAGCLCHGSERC
jgi:nucleoside 2-deoxyribosyltransferase